MVAIDDKREITALLTISMSGTLLPHQLIYARKTPRCHPQYQFPEDWSVIHSDSHWSTEATMLEYCDSIIKPYISKCRDNLNNRSQKALVIVDVFASHRTQSYKDKLLSMGCEFIYVPAGCTGDLQPLDLSVNDEYKKILKSKFINYYASVIESSEDDDLSTFKLSASLLKPLHAG